MSFAKLYNDTKAGQILIVIESGDNGPEVKISFQPEGLGVCSTSLEFTDGDSDEAWEKADAAFDLFSKEQAEEYVLNVLKDLGKSGLIAID